MPQRVRRMLREQELVFYKEFQKDATKIATLFWNSPTRLWRVGKLLFLPWVKV